MDLMRIALLLVAALAGARALDEGPFVTQQFKLFKLAISSSTDALDSIGADGGSTNTGGPPGVSTVVKAFELSQLLFENDATADVQLVAEAGFFAWLGLLLDHPFQALRYNACLFLRSMLVVADEGMKKFKRDLADKMFEEGIVARVIELAASTDDREKEMATYSLVDIVYLASDYHVPKLVHDGAQEVVCNAIRTVDDEAGGPDLMVKALETAKKLDYREKAKRTLEAYGRGGGGADAAQLAQIAQLTQMMTGAGMDMAGMPDTGGAPGGETPHELSIHAQLCGGHENFCRIFPCDGREGERKQLGGPADGAGMKEAVLEAVAAAVAAALTEERAKHEATTAALTKAYDEALARERKACDERIEAIEGAALEAKREETASGLSRPSLIGEK